MFRAKPHPGTALMLVDDVVDNLPCRARWYVIFLKPSHRSARIWGAVRAWLGD